MGDDGHAPAADARDNPYAAPASAAEEMTPVPRAQEIAGAVPRILAALIDLAYSCAVVFIAAVTVRLARGALLLWWPEPPLWLVNAGPLVMMLILSGFIAWNWGYLTRTRGASLGKLSLGLRVIRTDGTPCGPGEWRRIRPDVFFWVLFGVAVYASPLLGGAHHRGIPESPAQQTIAFWVGLLMILKMLYFAGDLAGILFDGKHRSLHDRLAGTLVVRVA
jgi:uncharacterized RDD family membrane protein YckC